MDAMLGRPNDNVVEHVLTSLNGTSSVDGTVEPRASRRGWPASLHIIALSPT